MTASDLDATPSEDWDGRALCSDEHCIGVLGPDAKCNVCGLSGELPAAGARAAADLADLHDTADDRHDADAGAGAADSENPAGGSLADTVDDSEFEDRELCPDENCIGVIGPEGVCKVCGANKHSQPA